MSEVSDIGWYNSLCEVDKTSRGWQQGPESAINEDTLDTLVMHGLINRVYLLQVSLLSFGHLSDSISLEATMIF